MKVIIGIDLGTSACKVLAMNINGEIIADVSAEYPCYFPQKGWSQQEPSDWWNGTVAALKKVTGAIGGAEIIAVGFSGQMHGMVALDAHNNVVRPAILWNDQRTKPQCAQITEMAGGLDSLLDDINNQMITGFTAGKILWMKQNEPENYAKTRRILNPKDYIRFMLTGEYITDVSEASGTGLYDVKNRRWSLTLIEKIGLDPSMLPKVVESTEEAGEISATAARLTGLPEGCPVSAGGGDAVISTTGLGLVLPGRVGITVGTSGVVSMGLPDYAFNEGGRLQLSCGNSPGTWHVMGATLSAAGAYAWFAENFGGEEKLAEKNGGKNIFCALDDLAAATPAGAGGLIFLPYLIGERCPVYDPDALGGFIGITGRHTKGHFARAVMEGVAFSLRQVYEEIYKLSSGESAEIVLAGGGAASPLWRRIFADVFDLPVRTVFGSKQGGAFAAALVAGVTAGVFESLGDTIPLITTQTEDLPDPENAGVYKAQFEKYSRLYGGLKWLWQ